MEGRELTARERGKLAPVTHADNDNQGLAGGCLAAPPPAKGIGL
jgi:hypothetical protein